MGEDARHGLYPVAARGTNASLLPAFERTIEITASKDEVWRVVSDVDNEPYYWHGTKSVLNKTREGNTLEREIVQNFRNARITQRVTFIGNDSVITEYLKGPTVGTKRVSVESRGPRSQVVRASWEVRFTGMLRLASPVIGGHVIRGTESALERIKIAAEGGPGAWDRQAPIPDASKA